MELHPFCVSHQFGYVVLGDGCRHFENGGTAFSTVRWFMAPEQAQTLAASLLAHALKAVELERRAEVRPEPGETDAPKT